MTFGLMFCNWFGLVRRVGIFNLQGRLTSPAILDREETAETATAHEIQNTNKELDDDPARDSRKEERKSS